VCFCPNLKLSKRLIAFMRHCSENDVIGDHPSTVVPNFSKILLISVKFQIVYVGTCVCACIYIYRVFHDLWTLLQEVIFYVFVIKKVYINMCPILYGYGVMTS
jgi:hypothetical protein